MRLIKEDKREYPSSLATQAEDAAASGTLKDLYDTTEKLAEKYTRTNNQVRDKEGNILTGEDEQLQQWVDHFSELLNRSSPMETPSTPEAPLELEVNCKRLCKEEIVKAIMKLKSGKAAGPDNILLETLEADPHTTTCCLNSLKRAGKKRKCQLSGMKATSSNSPRKEI